MWADFEARAGGTLYQNSLWCRAWMETVGVALGARPVLVTGHENGRLVFLLPLQVRRRQGVRVLEWLTSPHHNYGWPLLDPSFAAQAADWFDAHFSAVVSAVADVDAIALTENPQELMGRGNPLAAHFTLRGANPSFVLDLDDNFEALQSRRQSGERRRGGRKNEAGLAKLGEIGFGLPVGKPALHSLIDTMFRQQEARLAELGIHGVFGPVERQFIHRLAELQDEARPVLAPYHLTLDGEVLAVMLGGLHGNGYWALISSLAAGAARRHSPGDVALRRSIAACCDSGLDFFDFSSGDTVYKRAWADHTVDLSNIMAANNLRGLVWVSAMAFHLAVKRSIKASPSLLAAGVMLRRLLRGNAVRR